MTINVILIIFALAIAIGTGIEYEHNKWLIGEREGKY
jgi:hypothetical protein